MRHLVAAGLIAGSILRMPARAEVPSDREAVIEALIRQGFAGGCGPDGECLVAVEGKTPSRTLMLRIKDLRNVRAMPANYSGSGLIFDIGGVEFSAEGLAQAHGEIRGHGGPLFTSCRYHLRRVHGQWRLDGDKTECIIT
jgi:hypothetical protein